MTQLDQEDISTQKQDGALRTRFVWLGRVEGSSLLLLMLVAMPIKYLLGEPLPVRIVGSIHGLLFVLYVLVAVQLREAEAWSSKKLIQAWILSCLPGGTFFFECKLLPAPQKKC